MPDEIVKPINALRLDVNDDGQFTISDLGLWLVQAFFLPGDWLIWLAMTYAAPVARFLELDPSDYGGVLSGAISGVSWLAFFMLVLIVYRTIYNFDRLVTDSLARRYAEGRRRWRMAVTRLRAHLHRHRAAKRAQDEGVEFSEGANVSDAELRVLGLHAELRPGYALAVGEVASALEVGRLEASEMLDKLTQLGFLSPTLGGYEDETAYTLTRVGRAFLTFRRLG